MKYELPARCLSKLRIVLFILITMCIKFKLHIEISILASLIILIPH